ncbi:PEP-CTERM sorting domain-containing protein [Duganella callida]|uniref:PEP-CTERM sorting domain-containing protein n=2 Tax=Duganella callida TaxID=2561932 RepID=A0A4Y9S836_9BURK|nr:PEP-CTERM sorting domain-containing protein [Duganella callida]
MFGFDFAADGRLTIYNNSSIPAGAYKVSFDFGGTLNADIKSFTVSDAGVTGGAPVLSIVNPHTITLDLSAVEWNGDFNPLQTSITLAAAVPEPASVTMLMAGLLGLGLRARRRG